MKKKRLAILMAAVMSVSIFAGCGSSSSSSSSSDTSSEETTEEAADEAEEEASEEEAAEETEETAEAESTEGAAASSDAVTVSEIYIASERDPTDLGPFAGNMGGASAIVPLVYQTLYIRTIDETDNLGQPCLAKEIVDNGDNSYTVELFDYIYDSDGNHFTTSDIEYCIETSVSIGKVSSVKVVDHLDIVDDYNFTVYFDESARMGDYEGFFDQAFWVTQAAYEEYDGMSQQPVGTGQYVMSDYVGGSNIEFTKNEDYWQTDETYIALSSAAYADVINYPIITEAMQRAIAVESGTLDYGAISYTDYDRVAATEGVGILEVPDNLTNMLFMNMSGDSVLSDNLELREALCYALDNVGIASMVSSSYAVPVYDLSNSNYPDYYADYYEAQATNGENIYAYDTDKALELLEESGFDTSQSLTLICSSDENITDLAQIIQTYLAMIGIDVTIEAYQSSMVSNIAEDTAGWDLYLLQYASTDYAVNVWEKVLNEEKYSWEGTINFVFDDTLQEMLAEVRTTEGHTEEAVIAFHDYVADQAYAIGLCQFINYFAYDATLFAEDGIVMSDQRIIRPNSCTFLEQ